MSYIANTNDQRREMLKACGVDSIEELFADIPQSLRPRSFNLPQGKSEPELVNYFDKLARKNYSHLINFVGGGFYDHFIPAAIDALVSRSEFYTAYTPYQPELSQGTLQSIYEYQTNICRLTGLEIANASLYDGGTALYEACQMAISTTGRRKIIVDGGLNPIHTYTLIIIELVEILSPGQSNRESLFNADNERLLLFSESQFFRVVDDHSDIVEKPTLWECLQCNRFIP